MATDSLQDWANGREKKAFSTTLHWVRDGKLMPWSEVHRIRRFNNGNNRGRLFRLLQLLALTQGTGQYMMPQGYSMPMAYPMNYPAMMPMAYPMMYNNGGNPLANLLTNLYIMQQLGIGGGFNDTNSTSESYYYNNGDRIDPAQFKKWIQDAKKDIINSRQSGVDTSSPGVEPYTPRNLDVEKMPSPSPTPAPTKPAPTPVKKPVKLGIDPQSGNITDVNAPKPTSVISPTGSLTSPTGSLTSPTGSLTSPTGSLTSPTGSLTSPWNTTNPFEDMKIPPEINVNLPSLPATPQQTPAQPKEPVDPWTGRAKGDLLKKPEFRQNPPSASPLLNNPSRTLTPPKGNLLTVPQSNPPDSRISRIRNFGLTNGTNTPKPTPAVSGTASAGKPVTENKI